MRILPFFVTFSVLSGLPGSLCEKATGAEGLVLPEVSSFYAVISLPLFQKTSRVRITVVANVLLLPGRRGSLAGRLGGPTAAKTRAGSSRSSSGSDTQRRTTAAPVQPEAATLAAQHRQPDAAALNFQQGKQRYPWFHAWIKQDHQKEGYEAPLLEDLETCID